MSSRDLIAGDQAEEAAAAANAIPAAAPGFPTPRLMPASCPRDPQPGPTWSTPQPHTDLVERPTGAVDSPAEPVLVLVGTVLPAATATNSPRADTGEAAFAAHLWGRPGPGDTVIGLSRRFHLSSVYVRGELRRAGWPIRESAHDPVAPRRPRRPAVITLSWIVLGVADVIAQVYASAPPGATPT
jgi:hypothetical protein